MFILFKILYFHIKNNVNDYDFRLFLTSCGFMVIMIKNILPLNLVWMKNNFVTVVLKKIVKPQSQTVVLMIFLKLLKP